MFRKTTSRPAQSARPTTRLVAPMTTSAQWELRALLRDLANDPPSAAAAGDRDTVIDLRDGAATRRCS